MTNLDNNRNGGNPEFLTLTPSDIGIFPWISGLVFNLYDFL